MSNNAVHQIWFSLFQKGYHYMKTWPEDKRLAAVFSENRIVTATRFAICFTPPMAILTLMWQIELGGQLELAVSIVFLLVVCQCRVCGG